MVHTCSKRIPLYIVNEHPKSGATWVGQMLSKALEVPFPRNQLPKFEPCIMHGHYIRPWGMNNVVMVWRDGRDVIVSWYYHCYFKHERFNSSLVDMMKSQLPFKDYDNIKENLPKFIEFCALSKPPMRSSWTAFVTKWYNKKGVTNVHYEDFKQDACGELKRLYYQISGKELDHNKALKIAEEFSFAHQSQREEGKENKGSFLRKGIVGDWKNHFNQESCEIFDHFAGEELITLGYESNHEWVKSM
ncbi:MAG: sulfotransferase domain-containing protein [Cyanobacteria bacterium]|nr:sulfotransferase domain-containing protein [Cyanobacteria bacterium CG_2015-16_32_12]NCO78587.1 sulfotransferase domain-containing protein [Cyanobacteria bacterium CG_2015-22_32_23]NCQ02979.1 sulfotransferase domain-containing protein [Cyanobacteria bacterium CG_2015-09_32_10]NCQ41161.1 sulfotransferase domain-containing protein [Cyanobacteria bacterium CG_2015-04_32_10]NCS83670.1 sulfotransferase domain-containing protein [Cyanobacteria bacterium CG_2015-02_32_10]